MVFKGYWGIAVNQLFEHTVLAAHDPAGHGLVLVVSKGS